MGNLYRILENETLYPKVANNPVKSFSVNIVFVIDTAGNTTQVKLQQNRINEFDKEAKRVVESLGKSWTPAIIYSKKVSMSYMLPVNFWIL